MQIVTSWCSTNCLWNSNTTSPSIENVSPFRTEPLVLGSPSNVTTLLAPGWFLITRVCSPHVSVNVPKWLVGSALAVLAGTTRAIANAVSRSRHVHLLL